MTAEVSFRQDTVAVIKSVLTMRDVAEKYGFTPNRANFIVCPFHTEKTASCKLYDGQRGFYCHACHTGGSVIDFVMKLFEIPFNEAVRKLNTDFDLGLSLERPNRAELSRLMQQRQAEARRREEIKRREMELFDRKCQIGAEINRCEMIMEEHPPTRDGWNATFPPEWSAAVAKRERLLGMLEETEIMLEKAENEH